MMAFTVTDCGGLDAESPSGVGLAATGGDVPRDGAAADGAAAAAATAPPSAAPADTAPVCTVARLMAAGDSTR